MPYFNYTPSEIANGARGLVKAAFTPKSEMSEQRMNICRSCPYDLYETESGLCNKEKGGCGCYMPGKVKLETEHCPKGLW